MRLAWILGASGSGKSALCGALKGRLGQERAAFLTLDALFAEPAHPVHQIDIGSNPEAWQKAATLEWARRIAALGPDVGLAVMDGQSRWEFIREACASAGLPTARIILVHCTDEVRERRLLERGHLDLANEGMRGWARWLLAEAAKEGSPVLDTSELTVEQAARRLEALILA